MNFFPKCVISKIGYMSIGQIHKYMNVHVYIQTIFHDDNTGILWENKGINYFYVKWLGSTIAVEQSRHLTIFLRKHILKMGFIVFGI